MALELMRGQINFHPRECDLGGVHRKAVMYDDVRKVFEESGSVDIYIKDDNAVLSLWKVKGDRFDKPDTHIAILSSEPFDRESWYVVEEQQFYLYDEEQAVNAFISRLHQDNWREYEKTGSLFLDTTIEGRTETQFNADKVTQEAATKKTVWAFPGVPATQR